MWLEGISVGHKGRIPSSVVVETEIPSHESSLPLFAVTADLPPSQDGDLPLYRGTYISSLNFL